KTGSRRKAARGFESHPLRSRPGRKAASAAESAWMSAARSGQARRSLRERAARFNDAFGLVLALVVLTYVLVSLLDQRGWHDVVLTASMGLASVVALPAAHAQPRAARAGLAVAVAATACAGVAAIDDDSRTWLNISSLLGMGLLAVAMAAVLRRVLATAEIG